MDYQQLEGARAGQKIIGSMTVCILGVIACLVSGVIALLSTRGATLTLLWLVPLVLFIWICARLAVANVMGADVRTKFRDQMRELERMRVALLERSDNAEGFITEFRMPPGEVRRVLDAAGQRVQDAYRAKKDLLGRGLMPLSNTPEAIRDAEVQFQAELKYCDGKILAVRGYLERIHKFTMGHSSEQLSSWEKHIWPADSKQEGERPQHTD